MGGVFSCFFFGMFKATGSTDRVNWAFSVMMSYIVRAKVGREHVCELLSWGDFS